MVEMNIVKIANFLNDFDVKVRTRISSLNERLTKLERAVDFCDAAAKSTQDRLKALQNK
jgi:hypothetical protein